MTWCLSIGLKKSGGGESNQVKNTRRLTYRQQLAPSQRRRLLARACQRQSRWRRCWKSHHHPQWSCHWASDHRAGFRVPGSTTPSRRFRSGLRPVRRGWRYIPSGNQKITQCKLCNVGVTNYRTQWLIKSNLIRFRYAAQNEKKN